MDNDKKIAIIEEVINGMNDNDLVDLWRDFTSATNQSEYQLFYMGEIDELLESYTPSQILAEITGNDFDISDKYVYWDECGLNSTSEPRDIIDIFEVKDMADYIVKTNNCFYNQEIKNALRDINFEDGQYVEVVDTGEEYTDYTEWVEKNTDVDISLYTKEREPLQNGDVLKIVAHAKHGYFYPNDEEEPMLYLLENTNDSDKSYYLIGENGIKPWEGQ